MFVSFIQTGAHYSKHDTHHMKEKRGPGKQKQRRNTKKYKGLHSWTTKLKTSITVNWKRKDTCILCTENPPYFRNLNSIITEILNKR